MAFPVETLTATLSKLPSLILLVIGIQLSYWVGLGIYNVFFHALARFPGPKLWTAYRLPFVISMVNGNLTHQTKHFHEKYGSIVRTAPDELSFTNDAAWRDIHAYRAGHQNFPKSQLWNTIPNLGKRGPPKKPDDILNANDADHSRIRKLFSHSFSEKAVTEQEPLVQSYVDLLIAQLRKHVELNKGSAINISTWYSFTTFDIIGDLGFGEPFDCLKDAKYHAWVGMLVGQFKAATVGLAMQYYPLGRWFMQNLIPQKVIDDVVKHARFTDEKVRHRLSLEVDRSDFLSEVLRHNDEKGMTVEEIVETSNIMLVAGSETTALTLSGITSYLVKNSDVITKLVEEVRHTFKTDSDIKPGQVSKLPYLNAVIQEGFRLCPPIPDGFRREVPLGGDTICGEWIPEGTIVKFSAWAAYVSPSNFARPTEFLPERWLPETSSTPSEFANDNLQTLHPFSLGARNCIGQNLAWMELRLILARVIWNFDISLLVGSSGLDFAGQKTYRAWEKQPVDVVLTPA